MNGADSSQNLWEAQKQQRPRLRRRGTGANMATACDQCHRCKVRCNGGRPSCERCQKDDTTCTYSLGKPLGKPPKNGRRPVPTPSQPQPQLNMPALAPQLPTFGQLGSHSHSTSLPDSGQDGEFDYVINEAQNSTSKSTTVNGNTVYNGEGVATQGGGGEDGEPNSASSMEIEHDFPAPKAVMPSFERAEQYFSHEESQSLLWTTEDSFFEGAESVEGMNLDFLVSDFSPPSWAVSKSNENNSSTPLTLEMTMEKTGCSKSQLISPPESLPSTALSQSQGSSAEQSAEQPQKAVCLNIDNLETASASAPSKEVTRNEKSYQHLPLLLETTLRFYFKAPSATQAPISDALRLAKDGLQAIQCCLREFYLSSRAQASSSGLSSHDPSPPEPDSESSSILACIILMEKVLFCYDSLLKRRSGPGDVSSPYAPSPAPSSTSTSNPTASSSSGHHCMQPIFIGDFEVEDKASWKMILDAVVAAQKQEARSTISKLEDWASDLAGKGKNEGRLAISFLEQLKRKFHD